MAKHKKINKKINKAVNQNNIIDIIKSTIYSTNDLLDVMVLGTSDLKSMKVNSKDIKNYTEIINLIYGDIVPSLLNTIDEVSKIDKDSLNISTDVIEKITSNLLENLSGINSLIDFINNNILTIEDSAINNLKNINESYNEILNIVKNISDTELDNLKKISSKQIKKYLKKAIDIFEYINIWLYENERGKDNNLNYDELSNRINSNFEMVNNFTKTIEEIAKVNIKNVVQLKIKLLILSNAYNQISKFIDKLAVKNTDNDKKELYTNFKTKLDNIKSLLTNIIELIDAIASLDNTKLKQNKKALKSFPKFLELLNLYFEYFAKSVESINELEVKNDTFKKIKILKHLILDISILVTSLILLTPILAIFTLLSPIIIVGLTAFAKTVEFILYVAKYSANPRFRLMLLDLILFVGAIGLLMVGFLLLASISIEFLKSIPIILLALVGMTLLIGAIYLMSLLAPFMIPVLAPLGICLAVTLLSVSAILLIAGALLLLKEIKFTEEDKEIIKFNVEMIMDVAMSIIFSIFETEINRSENKNPFMKILNALGSSISNIFFALSASIILIATLVSVTAILLIASMLYLIKYIKFSKEDKETIKDNVKLVIDTAFEVINSILDRDSNDNESKPDERNWIKSVLTNVGNGVKNILDAILAVGFLALTVASVALVIVLAGELKLIEHINLNSQNVKLKINDIIGCAFSVIDSILGPKQEPADSPSSKSWVAKAIDWVSNSSLGRIFKGIKNITEMLLSVGFLALTIISVGMVYVLAKQLNYIEKIKISDKAVKEKTKLIIDTSYNVINILSNPGVESSSIDKLEKIYNNIGNVNKIISMLKSMSDVMSKFNHISDKDVENNTKTISNYIKYVDKINTLKIENVKSLTNMFKEMSRLSESIGGDFDRLADALSEKIAPLLQELRDLIKDVPKQIDSSSKSINQTIVDNAGGPASWTPDSIQRNITNSGNNMNTEQMRQEHMIKANETRMENEKITSLLQDILDVLSGRGAYPNGVKTQ